MKRMFLLLLLFISGVSNGFAVDMSLKSLDGDQHKLSEYLGKWVVVNYWATWCPPCLEEMPELQAFHDQHADKDGVVIGINTEVMDMDSIKAFLDDYFITYPNYHSGPLLSSELGNIPGLPTTFLVSPQGTLEARQVGGVTRELIENFIDKWEANHPKKAETKAE